MRLSPVTTAALFLLPMALAACEKSSAPPGEGTAQKDPTPASAAAATSAPMVPSVPSAPSTVVVADAEAGQALVGDAAVADAGKSKDGGGAAAALRPASKHVSGSNFTLDVASPGCKAASECAMTIKLVATGDYHVNEEYPYKFVASEAAGIEFLGKGDAKTFTRAAGDFAPQGEKAGTMTVRFKPSSPGEAHVSGTYKFSVCSADQCQIEQEKLELTVPVM